MSFKKTITLFLAVLILLSIVGCREKPKTESETSTESSALLTLISM